MGNVLKVSDNFRTNSLSLKPGGSTVETYCIKGIRLVYDKIKNPEAYILHVIKDSSIQKVYVDGILTWSR